MSVLSRDQVEQQMETTGEVVGVVQMDLSDIVGLEPDLGSDSCDQFFLELSEALIGSCDLQDIDYEVVDHDGNCLSIKVAGLVEL